MQSSKILNVAVYFLLVSHHNSAISAVSVERLVVLTRICTTDKTPLSRGIILMKMQCTSFYVIMVCVIS